MTTEDPAEIAKFATLAHEWWDPEGRFKPLHRINPLRVGYILECLGSPAPGSPPRRLVDVGCGGGILAEALGESGLEVTAIDRSVEIIGAAKKHQEESGSTVDYRLQSARELAKEQPQGFDAVTVMEVLEHIPDVPAFLGDCRDLLRPGGWLFFATLNRTVKSWLFAIVGAEYLLRWLPRGTHAHDRFIRPSELTGHLAHVGISLRDLRGMSYRPLHDAWVLSRDASVNYLGYGIRMPV
ncbi:MAG: bifunctional 2-polyprenyl-6-hydroxyphenol methylase/3-demethylubiquinol 3-O-methyltransferase UbiG [Magnetococcales bacterium]|nr:bifunctional 2-polyprenyl-6-hydroxyphenol methylase/3-demethylubiquinol 3-O-methyltransferase UbiG [Magnetococcales bacterium]MBF0156073.1 bifunctional 2-polyprenyl-6-hydroxyphenol methylase/3-demethylubiquinol 3-O-methyltransferase UbiG [Magnetococcales bacterium]